MGAQTYELMDGQNNKDYIPPKHTLYAWGIKVLTMTKESVLGQLNY